MKKFEQVDYIELLNGLTIGKNVAQNKFCLLETNDLSYTENDQAIWETDLYEHFTSSNKSKTIFGTYFFTKNNGRYQIKLNSLKEVEEITTIFRKNNFNIKFEALPITNPPIDKIFFNRELNISLMDSRTYGIYSLYIYIKSKKDYFKFRRLLLSLSDLGYYCRYNVNLNNEFYNKIIIIN